MGSVYYGIHRFLFLFLFFFQETRLNYRRNICAAARELDCKRELEEDRQQEQR